MNLRGRIWLSVVSGHRTYQLAPGGMNLGTSTKCPRLSCRKRIYHTDRSVPLSVGQILGVQYLRPRGLRGLDDERIPERKLITRLDVQRIKNCLAAVHD